MIDDATLLAILDAHAPMRPCALVPQIRAWHAVDEIPIWQAIEKIEGMPVGVPYFCLPWPGALGLARAVLDGLVDVTGAHVVDVGCGQGVAAVAALLAGAARVTAVDVDPYAVRAAALLATRHGLTVHAVAGDAAAVDDADVILAGDFVSSERQVPAWRAALARWGARAVVADSGRPFFDACGKREIARYDVATEAGVDGRALRTVRLFR